MRIFRLIPALSPILFLLLSLCSNAQVDNDVYGTVFYKTYNNLGRRVTSDMILKFNRKESYYLEILDTEKVLNEEVPEEVKNMFAIDKSNKLQNLFVHYDLETSKIVYNKRAFKTYQILEEMEKFDWQTTNEEKEIGNYVCRKAMGKFRGRNYEAWFAKEINVPFGPWKANNLGGLILELSEENDLFRVVATRITLSSTDNGIEDDINNNPYKDKAAVSIEKYGEIKRQEWEENLSVVKSRLPKGVFMSGDHYNTTDHLEYFKELDEWH